jgi:glycerol kinase
VTRVYVSNKLVSSNFSITIHAGWRDGATGTVLGLTRATTGAHILRAGMEAVTYRLAEVYKYHYSHQYYHDATTSMLTTGS